jgi:hypothetical protein
MAGYTLVHGAPPTSHTKRSGDVGIIEEVMVRKRHLEALTLVPLDQALAQRAKVRGIRTIHLHTAHKAQGNVGELLRTLAQYTDIQIYVQNEQVASLKREDTNTVRVRALKPRHFRMFREPATHCFEPVVVFVKHPQLDASYKVVRKVCS